MNKGPTTTAKHTKAADLSDELLDEAVGGEVGLTSRAKTEEASTAMFNPTEISIYKSIPWEEQSSD